MVLHKDRPGKKSTEIVQGNLVLNPICHYQLFFRQKDITRGENNEIRCAFCSCLGFIKIWKKKFVHLFADKVCFAPSKSRIERKVNKYMWFSMVPYVCVQQASQKCQVREHQMWNTNLCKVVFAQNNDCTKNMRKVFFPELPHQNSIINFQLFTICMFSVCLLVLFFGVLYAQT